ncbi:MAG: hypothetical protein GF411_04735 [Candidatus Lokiarchaeota archaeon]|nr:hypothetical protein [Candidatus Lokiarchaeota archaeon]
MNYDEKDGVESLARKLDAHISGGNPESFANGELNELGAEYKKQIGHARTSLLLLYRTICPYCEQLKPLLKDLANEYKSKVYFAMLDIDAIPSAREEFDVLGVPLVIAFKKGYPVGRVEGLRSFDEYDRWIESIHQGMNPMLIKDGPSTQFP